MSKISFIDKSLEERLIKLEKENKLLRESLSNVPSALMKIVNELEGDINKIVVDGLSKLEERIIKLEKE